MALWLGIQPLVCRNLLSVRTNQFRLLVGNRLGDRFRGPFSRRQGRRSRRVARGIGLVDTPEVRELFFDFGEKGFDVVGEDKV